MIGSDRFNGWISAAVDRGVKHLDLSTSVLPSSTLPIFTCKTLSKDFSPAAPILKIWSQGNATWEK
ncbi:hypothetical protein V6Z12_A01G082400 [Gossypium hirsutum]